MEVREKLSILALKEASAVKRKATHTRVLEALQVMGEKGLPMSFQSVARFAGVSKTWLYGATEIRQQIEDSRNKSKSIKRTRDAYDLLKKREADIDVLNKKLIKQENTIKELKVQLEVEYGELYKKNSLSN